jgi:hypothetical protein
MKEPFKNIFLKNNVHNKQLLTFFQNEDELFWLNPTEDLHEFAFDKVNNSFSFFQIFKKLTNLELKPYFWL